MVSVRTVGVGSDSLRQPLPAGVGVRSARRAGQWRNAPRILAFALFFPFFLLFVLSVSINLMVPAHPFANAYYVNRLWSVGVIGILSMIVIWTASGTGLSAVRNRGAFLTTLGVFGTIWTLLAGVIDLPAIVADLVLIVILPLLYILMAALTLQYLNSDRFKSTFHIISVVTVIVVLISQALYTVRVLPASADPFGAIGILAAAPSWIGLPSLVLLLGVTRLRSAVLAALAVVTLRIRPRLRAGRRWCLALVVATVTIGSLAVADIQWIFDSPAVQRTNRSVNLHEISQYGMLGALLMIWRDPFAYLETSAAHRVYEVQLIWEKIAVDPFHLTLGLGLGASVDLSGTQDLSVWAAHGDGIRDVRVFHFGISFWLLKFGLVGVIGYLIWSTYYFIVAWRFINHQSFTNRAIVMMGVATLVASFLTFSNAWKLPWIWLGWVVMTGTTAHAGGIRNPAAQVR